MEMSENQRRVPKDYYLVPEDGWRETRQFGIEYGKDSVKPDTHDLIVRLDGTANDLTDSKWTWGRKMRRKGGRTGHCSVVLGRPGERLRHIRIRGLVREGISMLPRILTHPLQRPSRAPLYTAMPEHHPSGRVGRKDPPHTRQRRGGKKMQAHQPGL